VRCAPADGRARSRNGAGSTWAGERGLRTPCRGSDIAAGELTRRAVECTVRQAALTSRATRRRAVRQCHCARAWHRGTRRVLHPGQVLDWDGSPKAGFHRCVRQDPDGTSGDKVARAGAGGRECPDRARGLRQGRKRQPEKTNDLPSRTAPRGVRCIGLDPGSSSSSCPGRSSSLPWCQSAPPRDWSDGFETSPPLHTFVTIGLPR